MSSVRQKFVIINQLGLHARAAAAFVKVANRYKSTITVKKDSIAVNCKSIMGVLMLAAPKGTSLQIEAVGEDAAAAVHELGELIRQKFGEPA